MALKLIIGTEVSRDVASLEEASAAWCWYRDINGFGARDMPEVYVQDGDRKVARISYNGRSWSPDVRDREIPLDNRKTVEAEVREGW